MRPRHVFASSVIALLLAQACTSTEADPSTLSVDGGVSDSDAVTSDASSPDGADDAASICASGGPACVVTGMTNALAPSTTLDGGALHPKGFIGDPTVLFENGKYRMWFTSSRLRTPCGGEWWECLVQGMSYAESVDGKTWAPYLTASAATELASLVFEPSAGSWDETGIETSSVLRGHDGKLWMFYTGHKKPVGDLFWDAIGLAKSEDGIHWVREGTGPVLEPRSSWERVCLDAVPDPTGACSSAWGGLLEPSVIWDAAANTYRMWYVGVGTVDGVTTYRVGAATSPDGLVWQRRDTPVLVPGAPSAWDGYVVSHVNVVADPCGGYHMFYHGSGAADAAQCPTSTCTGYTPGSIGYAFSDDGSGFVWNRRPEPLIRPAPGAWDGFFVGGPSALFRGAELQLFYFGNRNVTESNAFNSQVALVSPSCRRE